MCRLTVNPEETPDEAEESTTTADKESSGGSPDNGEAEGPAQLPGGGDTEKKVVQESSS